MEAKYFKKGTELTLMFDQPSDFGHQMFFAGDTVTVVEMVGGLLCNVRTENGTIITVPVSEVK